jgi:hypothetical protein
MKLVHLPKSGVQKDITALAQRYTWSGDYQEAARRLELELTVSSVDTSIPVQVIDLADVLLLYNDEGTELFRGYVFKKSKTLTGNSLSVTAYDGMIYLIKSELSKVFKDVTAEQVAEAVCQELGVQPGDMAETGISQSFAHLGRTGYEAIMTAYTTAGKHNGKLYMPRMSSGKMNVVEKGAAVAKRTALSSAHVTESTYGEDMESMVNTVVITDDKGNRFGTVSNTEWASTYGLLQKIYQQEQGKDAPTMAKALLQDINREASMEMLGGPDAYDIIAGNAIQIREAYTGLTGLFYIDSDSHTFENGQHTISLTLNFNNVMDEQEADELEPGDTPEDGRDGGSGDDDIWLELDQY